MLPSPCYAFLAQPFLFVCFRPSYLPLFPLSSLAGSSGSAAFYVVCYLRPERSLLRLIDSSGDGC